MGVDVSLVLKIADAVLDAAEVIVKQTDNVTDDKIVEVAKVILSALGGVFGDNRGLPEPVVDEAYSAAAVIKSEYGL